MNLRCQKLGLSYYNAQRRNYAKHQARMDPSCWHDKCEFSVARVVIEQSKSSQLKPMFPQLIDSKNLVPPLVGKSNQLAILAFLEYYTANSNSLGSLNAIS